MTEIQHNQIEDKPKFFGRRKGRVIHKAKSTLLEKLLPKLRIRQNSSMKKENLFNIPVEKVYLEIGFGNGEHLAGQAKAHPEIGFIGAEVFQNGVAKFLTQKTPKKDTLPDVL